MPAPNLLGFLKSLANRFEQAACPALFLAVVLYLTGCASRPYRPPTVEPSLPTTSSLSDHNRNGHKPVSSSLFLPPKRTRVSASRIQIVHNAVSMLGASVPYANGRRFRADCSGFVQAVYSTVDIDLFSEGGPPNANGVAIIHHYAMKRGGLHGRHPIPGDLVFFDGTYGPASSRLTHIGIVERVESDGTVVFVHYMRGRVVRSHMNREAPGLHRHPEEDRVMNDYMRRGSAGRRKAGELFAGYGTIIR